MCFRGSKSTETPVGLTDESAGYKHLGHMRGYACAGNVFVMPTPDVKAAAAAAANAGGAAATAAPAASLLEQGLALLRSWGLDRWLGKPELAKPTYLGYIAEGKGQWCCTGLWYGAKQAANDTAGGIPCQNKSSYTAVCKLATACKLLTGTNKRREPQQSLLPHKQQHNLWHSNLLYL